jgi:hypothetical protein
MVAPGRHRDGLQADRHGRLVHEAVRGDAEDFEAVIGGIRSEEQVAAWRQRQGTDLAALKERERRGSLSQGAAEEAAPQPS